MNILKNEWLKFKQQLKPYQYNPENYKESFITNSNKVLSTKLERFPKVIFTFWTGNNAMSLNRETALNKLTAAAGVPVTLITPHNLSDYILKEHPLHPAYEYLSLVHKADYLRCYFMHFHGGGYSDIKAATQSWEPIFDLLQSSDKWIAGYPEKKYRAAARTGGKMQRELEHNFLTLIGNCAYISRPQTPFTLEWYTELQKRMDYYAPNLALHKGNVLGDNDGYPIPWTGILGQIFHPLCLKYHDNLLRIKDLRPIAKKHR